MAKHRKTKLRWGRIIPFVLAICAFVATGVFFISSLLTSQVESLGASPVVAAIASIEPTATVAPTDTPTPTATPTSTPVPTPELLGVRTIHMRVVGDLMNHDKNLDAANIAGSYDFSSFFAAIAPSLKMADLTIGNLETTIGEKPSGYPSFQSPPSYLVALQEAGFDVLTLANNHIVDKGFKGIQSTVEALDAQGIAYAGAYAEESHSQEPCMIDVQGISIAILAYAEYTNQNTDVAYAVSYLHETKIANDVAKAREIGADIVVAMVHWGVEYSQSASANQMLWAKRLANAGVDIVLGSHPHVVEPAQWIDVTTDFTTNKRCFVAYSMGNFISNQRTKPRDAGVIFDFTIEKDLDTGVTNILEVGFVPTWVQKNVINGKPTFCILPVGKYKEGGWELLSASEQSRMRSVWKETTALMVDSMATPLDE